MAVRWLDRRIAAPGPYLCLCLSEQEYKQAFKSVRAAPVENWIKTPQADATTHVLHSGIGLTIIVCLSRYLSRNPVEVAGLLVHESVHVWQEWCEYYGEQYPAKEQEAYAIQSIAQELMAEFSRRMNPKRK